MTDTTTQKTLSFPTELLLTQSSRSDALYDGADDPNAFWELACWNKWLSAGLYQGEESFLLRLWGDSVSWKKIAVDAITRDRFYKQHACAHMPTPGQLGSVADGRFRTFAPYPHLLDTAVQHPSRHTYYCYHTTTATHTTATYTHTTATPLSFSLCSSRLTLAPSG
ncbi:hypothetical protein NUW54_g10458 [Trametes sanguinea]|uniref:Uncharacterized protein n=1 Tax=Trametes sanguinea TaxID=158606 RepID=A0ACC1P167_9APHY|nr:hypothetical protein NUW54_g10458 [Trametes sanguinea]